ncbi:Uncharacterized protein, DUF1810 family [Arthrobacter alpinus]|uniref:Uncharacterized protein, DUF1810 family n=1 Tax=Arthrobacter alpinus TaxID=656366 RepID=A0A1H5KZ27_9MICC|nr:DUF1810 domain-containing protein [Arthrobacter alpinus]SEE69970.1 Uncharacterized protein, DUF1810 family [Arthrobacter alpinus]
MSHNLDHFLEAQDPIYSDVTAELAAGLKTTHWMWFVFPQISGLGSSPWAKLYAIASLQEAVDYAAHPVLGTRLRECVSLVLATRGLSAEEIFGKVDARKLQSSMTLFSRAVPEEGLFREVLERFYAGVADPATEEILANSAGDPGEA